MRPPTTGRRPASPALAVLAVVASAVIVTACASTPSRTSPPQVPHGNPQQGVIDIQHFGCGACHVIPGIRQASGLAGPPLIHWSERGFIAGEIPNDGPNLIRWLMDPRAIEPKTDMPDLGISEEQARDIAAYLFSIH
jgi:cytochrome c